MSSAPKEQVENDQIRVHRLDCLCALGRDRRQEDLIPFFLEQEAEGLKHVPGVVDDENACGHGLLLTARQAPHLEEESLHNAYRDSNWGKLGRIHASGWPQASAPAATPQGPTRVTRPSQNTCSDEQTGQ